MRGFIRRPLDIEHFFGFPIDYEPIGLLGSAPSNIFAAARATSVVTEDGMHRIQIDAPGLKKADFNITVIGDMLTVIAVQKSDTKRMGPDRSLNRSFRLPERPAAENISATYEDGILTINVTLHERDGPVQIAVK